MNLANASIRKALLLSSLLLTGTVPMAPAFAADPPAFEYHGYMRSGIGASRGGADQECFGAPNASAKFRFGNECETYLEATFVNNHAIGPSAPGAYFSTYLTLAAKSSGRHDWEPSTPAASGADVNNGQQTSADLTLALVEAYVQGIGVLGTTKPWVGKRYYRRQNIDMLDYWIINNTGPGAGIEDIDVGKGHLNIAVTRNTVSDHDDSPPQDNPDLRWSDIGLGKAGKLELLLIYGATGSRGHNSGGVNWEAVNGEQFGFVHTLDFAKNTNNRVTVEYGRGIFGGDGSTRANLLDSYGTDASHAIKAGDATTLAARKKSYSLRLAEEYMAEYYRHFSGMLIFLYQSTDFGGYKDSNGMNSPRKSETMVGTKQVAGLTPTASIAAEYGYVNVENAFASDGHYKDATLHKFTVAPQLSAPEYFGRPQLRLFFTYAKWNSQAKSLVGGPVYASSTNGFSTGAQLESWW